jgi:hypothetical protein
VSWSLSVGHQACSVAGCVQCCSLDQMAMDGSLRPLSYVHEGIEVLGGTVTGPASKGVVAVMLGCCGWCCVGCGVVTMSHSAQRLQELGLVCCTG